MDKDSSYKIFVKFPGWLTARPHAMLEFAVSFSPGVYPGIFAEGGGTRNLGGAQGQGPAAVLPSLQHKFPVGTPHIPVFQRSLMSQVSLFL